MKRIMILSLLFVASTFAFSQKLEKGFWKYQGDEKGAEVPVKAFEYQADEGALYIFEYDGYLIAKYGAGKIAFQSGGYLKFTVNTAYGIKKKEIKSYLWKYKIVDDNTIIIINDNGKELKYVRV